MLTVRGTVEDKTERVAVYSTYLCLVSEVGPDRVTGCQEMLRLDGKEKMFVLDCLLKSVKQNEIQLSLVYVITKKASQSR